LNENLILVIIAA